MDWMHRIDLHKEIQEVYLHTFLFKLGIKLVAIFLPFYILELGFGIMTVFLFFLAYYATYLFVSWVNAYLCSRLGYKHTMLLASPFILLFYLGLRGVETQAGLLGLALIGGVSYNLYWTGMNPELGESSEKDSREKETGLFLSMPQVAAIFSPMIGGVILAFSGFNALFLTSATLIGASFMPFLFTQEHYNGMSLNLKQYIRHYQIKDFLTFFLKGYNSIGVKMLWPAYLALVIGGSVSIGGAGSLMALGSAATSILIGRVVNASNRARVVSAGMMVAALSYLGMSIVATPITAFIVSLANGVGYTAGNVPIYSKAVNHAEQEDLIEYFAVREFAIGLGRTTAVLAAITAFTIFQGDYRFLAAFTATAISVLATAYVGSKM